MWPFKAFLLVHVTTGAVGLLLFWIPVLGKKGGANHRKFGRLYARLMMVTAAMALGMGTNTLLAPIATHRHLQELGWSASRIQGIFGWMMLYLAILTMHLVWHGVVTIRNKREHRENRRWVNVGVNVVVIVAALVCAWRGWLISETLMMGIAVVGVASGLTNLWFIYTPEPSRMAYQLEHVKAIVGSGISVYTAFMAFGLVRLRPENALNPRMWAIPLVIGLAIIIYQQTRIRLAQRRPATAASPSQRA